MSTVLKGRSKTRKMAATIPPVTTRRIMPDGSKDVTKRVAGGQYGGYRMKMDGHVVWSFRGYNDYATDRDLTIKDIRAAYEKSSWSISTLATWSGVSYVTLSNVLNGKRRYPRLDTLWRIAKALEINTIKLY